MFDEHRSFDVLYSLIDVEISEVQLKTNFSLNQGSFPLNWLHVPSAVQITEMLNSIVKDNI